MITQSKIFLFIFIASLIATNFLGVILLLHIISAPTIKIVPKNILSPIINRSIDNLPVNLNTEIDTQKEKDNLEKLLTVKSALLGVSDSVSLYYKDLSKKYEISIEPNLSWVPASTIKAFVVLEAFRQKDNGLVNFDQKIIINSNNVVPTELETYNFPQLSAGTRITIRELLEMMVTQSDNTAYNTLLDIFDRRNINATLKKLGYLDTIVGEKINLDDQQYQIDLQVHGRQQNKTTIHDFSMLFNMLYDNKIPHSNEILNLFKKQKINYMLPSLLPPDITIAHKTGELSPYYHDGGIVYKPVAPYILAVFTNSDNPQIVSELSKTAYFRDDSTAINGNVNYSLAENNNSLLTHGVKKFALNISNNNVLGAKTVNIKIPYTAGDYGITSDDITITKDDTIIINNALITPRNIIYPLKRLWENITLVFEINNDQKIDFYLNQTSSRLREIKTMLENNNIQYLSDVLKDYESSAKQSLNYINKSEETMNNIIFVKQLNDLLFAVLNKNLVNYPYSTRKILITLIYNFYKLNSKEILNIIKNNNFNNPYNYNLTLGKIIQKNGNTLKIELQDKKTLSVKTFISTQIRSFSKKNLGTIDTLSLGDNIGIIGHSRDKNLTPFFILGNIPKGFPKDIKGRLSAIDFDNQIITLIDDNNRQNNINFNKNTIFKAKNTAVTPESIQPGSIILARGEEKNKILKANTFYILTNN